MMSTKSKAFVLVLMPFDERFNDLYKLSIKTAIEGAGADCERVDEQIFDEQIMQRVYEQIYKADIVVAEVQKKFVICQIIIIIFSKRIIPLTIVKIGTYSNI